MKNKFSGYCYVCGEAVDAEEGLAEQLPREPGEVGFGGKKLSVRHKECKPPEKKEA